METQRLLWYNGYMKKEPNIQVDYTAKTKYFQLVLPINYEVNIPADDSVRLLSNVLEELDYTDLYQAYSRNAKNNAATPKNLFKVLVYGYMNNLYSSRQIETACRRDINFMYLLEGAKAPDHNTIARFRSKRLKGIVDDLFSQVVLLLRNYGELSCENLFVDGTKIEANANKYTFVWKKTVLKNQAKLQVKMHKEIPVLLEKYAFEMYIAENIKANKLKKFLDRLKKIKHQSNIVFTSGKGKHKTEFQRDYELLSDWYEREKQYEYYLRKMKDRNSLSKTDETATFMHLKEDHMKNSQLKPAYNVQIAVDAEYIVATEIFNDRTDVNTFISFMEKTKQVLGFRYMYPTADAGYESEENYTYFEKNGQEAYIKPANYEQSKTRKYKQDIGRAENMQYDEATDTYRCSYGRKLVNIGNRTVKTASGYIAEKTRYQCENCNGCPYKAQCIKNNARCNTPLEERTKRFELSKAFQKQREQMLERITTKRGILLRINRSIQVEGAFGVLKEDMGFRRFLTRGTANVRTEIMLLCLAYNIQKLHNKTIANRQGQFLHELKSA